MERVMRRIVVRVRVMVAARLRVMVRVRGDGKVEEVNDRCGRWWLEIDVGRFKERGVHNVCVSKV